MLKKIIIEVPTSWIDNPIDGYKHRNFFCNLLIALSKRNIPLYLMKVPYGADTAPRLPAKGVMVFSYHSHGGEGNVWHLKEAPITPLFAIDKAGYSGWADVVSNPVYQQRIEAISVESAQEIIARYRQFFKDKGLSKYPQGQSEGLQLPEKYVFFPLQVQNDPVSKLSELDALDMLQRAADCARERNISLVVKRHPFCQSLAVEKKLARTCQDNPWVIQVDANIHALIARAHSVITVNSGAGLEALLDGAAVYCSGKSEWYAAANPLISLDDVVHAFDATPVMMDETQQKLVAFLVSDYWLNPDDAPALERQINRCMAEFDHGYGIEEADINGGEVLLPIILDLQGRLEYEMRRTEQAVRDLAAVLEENRRLRETARVVQDITRENMQLGEDHQFLTAENLRLQEITQMQERRLRVDEQRQQQEEKKISGLENRLSPLNQTIPPSEIPFERQDGIPSPQEDIVRQPSAGTPVQSSRCAVWSSGKKRLNRLFGRK